LHQFNSRRYTLDNFSGAAAARQAAAEKTVLADVAALLLKMRAAGGDWLAAIVSGVSANTTPAGAYTRSLFSST